MRRRCSSAPSRTRNRVHTQPTGAVQLRAVPTEPITAAQCEAIVACGGDPFAEYMLLHASLRLKQGFGRLIRTSSDRGVVVIGDSRVVTKRYGRGLLEALPEARQVIGRWSVVLDTVREFHVKGGTMDDRRSS